MKYLPRYSTPLTPSRKNLLPVYEKVAQAMGWETLQEWQRYVISLATEIGEDGLPAYSEINITLPRQNGKSVLMALVFLVRLLAWPGGGRQVVMLGAQDALSAKRLLVDGIWPRLQERGLAQAAGMLLRKGGNTDLRLKNGNHLYLMTSNASSGHGATLSTAIIDECWSLTNDDAIQAAAPAMITVKDSQLWLASTMGTESSIFWQGRVDKGRAVSLGKNPAATRTAYIEWSAPPDSDCDDPEVWAAANPAYGTLISHASILAIRESSTEPAFRRAVLNEPVVNATARVIPELTWREIQDPKAKPTGGIIIGLDITPERKAGAIVAADGEGRIEVIEHRRTGDWLAGLAEEIWRENRDVLGVALIGSGPLSGIVEELERKRLPVYTLSATQSAAASALFYDSALGGGLQIRPDLGLDHAVAAATRRSVGAGLAWAWGRTSTEADVSPLIAASLAYSVAKSELSKPARPAPSLIDIEAEAKKLAPQVRAWENLG